MSEFHIFINTQCLGFVRNSSFSFVAVLEYLLKSALIISESLTSCEAWCVWRIYILKYIHSKNCTELFFNAISAIAAWIFQCRHDLFRCSQHSFIHLFWHWCIPKYNHQYCAYYVFCVSRKILNPASDWCFHLYVAMMPHRINASRKKEHLWWDWIIRIQRIINIKNPTQVIIAC